MSSLLSNFVKQMRFLVIEVITLNNYTVHKGILAQNWVDLLDLLDSYLGLDIAIYI
jgi:hypothetical protein